MSNLYNREEAVQYLNQILALNEKINMLIDERNDLFQMCTTTGSFDYSGVKVQSSKPLEARFTITMERYMDLEAEIDKKIDEFVEMKRKITDEISLLQNHLHIRLLKWVFIEGKSIRQVLTYKNWKYKESKTYDLYKDALDAFYSEVLTVKK